MRECPDDDRVHMLIWPEEIREQSVMVVDPDRAALDQLRIILDTDGYTHVSYVLDPREAASCFERTRPALVILALAMPGLDGFGVMEQLRELATGEPPSILVLTGGATPELQLRALAAGARDLLGRSFTEPELLVRVANLLETRLLTAKIHEQNRVFDDRVNQRTAELRASQLEVVYRLAMAAERRDFETGQHIVRMSQYCGLVAAAGGWAATDVEMLTDASPLHDVGKIAIPDSILLKPGKLSPEEWVTMRSHTTIGADMLRGGTSPVMSTGRAIALSHHERWDGSGYPEGLAGVEIPLVARICAVADVFDAVTSDRCYHRAMDLDTGVRMIRDGAGKHFDPNVVGWFDRALPEILSVANRATR